MPAHETPAALFARFTLDAPAMEMARTLGAEIELQPGETAIRQAENNEYMFLLVEGELVASLQAGGGEAAIACPPGEEGNGEAACLLATPRLSEASAAQPSRLLRLPLDETDLLFRFIERISASASVREVLAPILAGRLRAVAAQRRQDEKMATLGRFTAGLAHELNNPAAAAGRAAGALRENLLVFISQVWDLGRLDLSPVVGQALESAVRREPPPEEDALTLSDREEELASWLDEALADEGWKLAPALARAGLDPAWLDDLSQLTGPVALGDVLACLEGALNALEMLGEIEYSTRRISELVKAVRSYAYAGQSPQEVDVHAGLESSLVILGHKLKDRIKVVREYAPDLPHISGYAGELSQVWTNLIDNAIDALDGGGTIWIRTSHKDGSVLVEIADDGPGIPPEIQARIFEPFFTTKEAGKGTGLGLDISRRIITSRHQGELSVDSRPGDTRFRARLPVHVMRGEGG